MNFGVFQQFFKELKDDVSKHQIWC